MAPFTDPKMDALITRYYESECNPKFLYDGSQENIVKELHAWVIRRQQVSQEQLELREKIFESTLEVKTSRTAAQHDAALAEGDRALIRAEAADKEEEEDTDRAAYLLDTLKHRGILWPKLWWRPDYDGGVCSFLGTVDRNFDPDYTLAMLEDPHREGRFEAKRAEIEARVNAKNISLFNKSKKTSHSSDASEAGEKNTGEGNSPEGETMKARALISAMNTHPAKWAKIVKAVDSGNYPHIKIDEAKLVATARDRAESEIILKRFLADIFKDLDDE